jgi:hypothetical protein
LANVMRFRGPLDRLLRVYVEAQPRLEVGLLLVAMGPLEALDELLGRTIEGSTDQGKPLRAPEDTVGMDR